MAHKTKIKATQLIAVIGLLLMVTVFSFPENTLAQSNEHWGIHWGEYAYIGSCSLNSQPFIYQNSTFDVSIVYGQPCNWTEFQSFSYSLDGSSDHLLNYSKIEFDSYWNFTIAGTLQDMANGNHTLVFHGNYADGSTCQIWNSSFEVDTTFKTPVFTVISPLNQTYYTRKIDIAYTVDSPTIMAYYSIDSPGSRPSNYTTFNGSRSLTLTDLSDGNYKVSFWVRTEAGEHIYIDEPYARIETVYFTVDTTPQYTPIVIAAVVAAGVVALICIIKFKGKNRSVAAEAFLASPLN